MESINTSFSNRIIRPKELAAILGVSPETIRLWRKGNSKREPLKDFPQPIQIGARAIGWRESEIDSYMEKRRIQRQPEATEETTQQIIQKPLLGCNKILKTYL